MRNAHKCLVAKLKERNPIGKRINRLRDYIKKYYGIFTEIQDTLLVSGTTNASPRQCNNGGIPGSIVFHAVRRQADSDTTTSHTSTELLQREVFSVGSAQRLYKESRWELWVSSEYGDCEWVCRRSQALAKRTVSSRRWVQFASFKDARNSPC
jgi:hypothetical protein